MGNPSDTETPEKEEENNELGNPPEGIASDEENYTPPVKEEKAKSNLGEVSGFDKGKAKGPHMPPPEVPSQELTTEPGTPGPNEDGSFSQYTAPGYTVGEAEKGLFHVELESPKFSPTTGQRLSKPFVQKYNPASFASFFKTHRALGYVINKWLHQPATEAPRKRRAKR